MIPERINQLIALFDEQGIDGLLVTNESNVRYLTSFSGDSSVLLVHKQQIVFITDKRYEEQAQNECPEEVEIRLWYKDRRFGFETYQMIIDNIQIRDLGFEENSMSYASYRQLDENLKNVRLKATSGVVEALRLIKSNSEIENLREACRISDSALKETVSKIEPGITEKEIAALLDYNLRMEGADDISFETIVLTGKRSSLLHGKPGDIAIQEGDYLLFDFGALCKGYHADISRTFIIGTPNDQQTELYNIIFKCQQSVVKALKHNVSVREINKIVEDSIPKNYEPYFYPGYGHGVGLDIHEPPFLKDTADFTFKAGMVLTVEPGIYIPDWGGLRIEDTVLVTENSARLLSNYPRELTTL